MVETQTDTPGGHVTIESSGGKIDKKKMPLEEKLLHATNDINGAVVDLLQRTRKAKEKLGLLGATKLGVLKILHFLKNSLVAIYNGTLKYLSKEQLVILGLACFAVWPYLTPTILSLIHI